MKMSEILLNAYNNLLITADLLESKNYYPKKLRDKNTRKLKNMVLRINRQIDKESHV